MRWLSWAAAVGVAVFGIVIGLRAAGPEVRIGARGAWRSLSEGVRRAGRDDVLSVGPQARLFLRGLDASHLVRLRLAARPGDGERRVSVSCGNTSVETRLTSWPKRVELRECPGGPILLETRDAAGARPYHLHEILIVRGGIPAAVVLPAVFGLAAFAIRRRSPGHALLWSVAAVAVAIPMVVAVDPLALAQHARATQDRVLAAAAALVAVAALAEPGFRARAAGAARWLGRDGVTFPKIVLAVGVALLLATVLHAPGLNGPSYWRWTWRALDGRAVFPMILMASGPFFVARVLHRRGVRTGYCLALLGAGVLGVEAAALAVQPSGLDRWHTVVENPGVTGYFTDAQALAATPDWLATHPHRMWRLHTHSRTKPPGAIVFYAALLGTFATPSLAAVAGALLIALAAAAAVPAVYALARTWASTPEAAFESASLMAWSPGLILFLPEFDQTFPLVTCLILIAWTRALTTGRVWPAVVFALLAAAVSFFSYSFLVLGVAGLVLAARHRRAALRAAAIAVGVLALVYAALYAATRFDPIATFLTAVDAQRRMSVTWGRAYLPAVLHDPLDFALGAGWMAAVLAMAAVFRAMRTREGAEAAGLGALQIGAVDVSGILRVEAARVWLLLVPLVMVPAGRELARWTPAERTAGYVVMALLLAAVTQNMTFIDLGAAP